ncbi:MAG: hypothetical protein V4502_05900 [Pseudomonadota bacterium]
MKQMLMLAGAAALAFAGPAFGKPGNGNGRGNGHGYAYGLENERGGIGYGVGGCPPGLAKKNNGCLPPGQAKKLYGVGQRIQRGALSPYGYNQIPYSLRQQYGLSPYNNYYYNNGYLYGVNPRTMIVQQAIAALLGR